MAETNQAIINAIDAINKKFGKGSVANFEENIPDVEFIRSGSLGLDQALGGGYPKGRIIEIYGPESSGKSTLALHAIAEAHKAGGVVAYIDSEHAFDPKYAEALGVDLSKEAFLFSQPSSGEEALEIAEMLIKTGKLDIVVIDSVAALTPKAELEGEMGDSKMGLQARLMSQALRKITGSVSKTDTLVIFINQLREKIGVMFGNPETTTGGNALKFYASQRLDIRKVTINKDGEESISNTVKVKVIKNKVAPPFRTAIFNLVYGHGIDRIAEIITLGVDLGVIQKSGSWYSYDGSKLGQGAEGVKSLLVDNPDLLEELQLIISKKLK